MLFKLTSQQIFSVDFLLTCSPKDSFFQFSEKQKQKQKQTKKKKKKGKFDHKVVEKKVDKKCNREKLYFALTLFQTENK